MPEFDRFDDNTFAVTISLAEYRALVQENARMQYSLEMMQQQMAILNEQLADGDGFVTEGEYAQPDE